jgi:hypothetical protein
VVGREALRVRIRGLLSLVLIYLLKIEKAEAEAEEMIILLR